ncbi:hypothetical protein NDU88_002604 [Pleurodeles waltl]|uniref:Uncharacterized protein n=1 Tax=Pleurodeles waltl TaxID=8319 RepID=A0AAV7UA69_PLEWA|nr:hypothetical protein NDU88_002604 [Pleurodeles waltl]
MQPPQILFHKITPASVVPGIFVLCFWEYSAVIANLGSTVLCPPPLKKSPGKGEGQPLTVSAQRKRGAHSLVPPWDKRAVIIEARGLLGYIWTQLFVELFITSAPGDRTGPGEAISAHECKRSAVPLPSGPWETDGESETEGVFGLSPSTQKRCCMAAGHQLW